MDGASMTLTLTLANWVVPTIAILAVSHISSRQEKSKKNGVEVELRVGVVDDWHSELM